jgi:secreted trypsin-like serine protease
MRRLIVLSVTCVAFVLGLGTVRSEAVVGGSTVAASSYPWLAAVGSPAYLTRDSGQFCGGALVAPDKVLTAAHCVTDFKYFPWALRVTFGATDLAKDKGQTVWGDSVWIDPNFGTSKFQGTEVDHNDVAVITLDSKVNRPLAPLVTADQTGLYQPGAVATILGWGTTSESDDSNTVLHQAQVPLVADSGCQASYGSSFVASQMVCAGLPSGGVDTCEYDSGGPLVVDGVVAGVTSWGQGCAEPGYPGTYARLTSYITEIRAHI